MPQPSARLALVATAALPLALGVGCAHEVIWIGDEPAAVAARDAPLPMTVAVGVRSFEAERLAQRGVVERFARELRETGLFQGVMYPVPSDARPMWEIELLARDAGAEPDSNFWKAGLAAFLFPLAFAIYLEDEYTLDVEALLVRNREIVRTYAVEGRIRNRYQPYANKGELRIEGAETILRNTIRALIDAMARDAVFIERVNTR